MLDHNNLYPKRVQLLIHVLPHITKIDCFALKGGTAINFFIRDLPRLSVLKAIINPIRKGPTFFHSKN